MFLRDKKTRTSLKVGDTIVYDLEGGLISIGHNGNRRYLSHDDDKILLSIKDKIDVIEIIHLIATVTNTRIESTEASGGRSIPGHLLFEVKEVYEVPA